MKTKKFFCGVLAAAFALSLAGADIASAQYGACGRGQGGGRGVCVQTDQSQTPVLIIRARAGEEAPRVGSSVCVTAVV